MKLTVCTYRRWNDATGTESHVQLVAHVAQDSGTHCDSELCLVWHDQTIADMKRLEFSAEEYLGATEAIEARFNENEREQIRLASVRQRQGSEVAA